MSNVWNLYQILSWKFSWMINIPEFWINTFKLLRPPPLTYWRRRGRISSRPALRRPDTDIYRARAESGSCTCCRGWPAGTAPPCGTQRSASPLETVRTSNKSAGFIHKFIRSFNQSIKYPFIYSFIDPLLACLIDSCIRFLFFYRIDIWYSELSLINKLAKGI